MKYVVIGGMAMAHHGLVRATKDIDLLVEPSPQNVERIRKALTILDDQASLDIEPTDLQDYLVVRVADEVIIDLLALACGIAYLELRDERETVELDGVEVPFLSARAMLRTKQTLRERDVMDRRYLEQLIASDEA